MYLLSVMVCVLVPMARAAVPSIGACNPNIRGIFYFNKARYAGVWYEYSNVFEIFQIGSMCVRATYTDLGNSIGVFNEQVNMITGNYGNVQGTAKPVNDRAEFVVGFDGIPFAGNSGSTTPNYRVLDTDYTSYAIVYNCSPFTPIFKKESLWLLTREQYPPQSLVNAAYSKMKALALPVGSLEKTPQNNCSKLPAPGQGNPQNTIESLG